MVQFRFCLLLAALCACCAASEIVTTQKPIIIPIPMIAEGSKPDLVKETSVPIVTEELKPENKIEDAIPAHTPELKAPTPDSAPSTTLASSTTPAPATTSPSTPASTTPALTTPAPPAPPAPSPAPTPAPGPYPPPVQGTWMYPNETSNVTCIVVQFAAQVNVTYTKVKNNVTSLAYVIFNVPANASVVGGSCDAVEQLITISWPVDNSDVANTMTLSYYKNDSTKSYGLKSLEFALSPDQFINASSKAIVELNHGAEWQTPLATSYRCAAPERLHLMGDAASGAVGVLTFSKLQEEAYRSVNGTSFSAARECGGGDVPDAVPIAVGCALGGLVVVVLVAYLVGRRRSAARGYLSM